MYLHLNTENALNNIKRRGRSYEQGIEPEYLKDLSKNYFEYFKQEKSIRFLVIDTNGIDFVNKIRYPEYNNPVQRQTSKPNQ